jgi:hypothetical protein
VRGFGETHRQELASTPSVADQRKADQEALDSSSTGAQRPSPTTTGTGTASTGINPAQLNNTPAPVPISAYASSGTAAPPTAGSPTIPPTASLNAANNKAGSGAAVGAAAVGAGVAALSTSPPSGGGPRPVVAADIPPSSDNVAATAHPTLAETGVPITSPTGPGPKSGSLKSGAATGTLPTWSDPPAAAGRGGAKYETAEEEKRRLDREDRERYLRFGTGGLNKPGSTSAGTSINTSVPAPTVATGASASTPTTSGAAGSGSQPRPETAEEEKRRLEREERERVLRGESTSGGSKGQPPRGDNPDDGPDADGEQLPSYKP